MSNASKPSGVKATGFRSDRFSRARWSLTIIYVALLAVILFFSSGIVYSFFSQRLEHRFERLDLRFNDQRLIIGEISPPPTSAEVLEDLLFSLLFVDGFFLVIVGFLSYWLAEATLKPIKDAYEFQKQFLSDASHELRTPLAILQTDLENELIVEKSLEARVVFESHLEEVKRMSRLVGDLLTLSRIADGENIVKKNTVVDLQTVVSETVERLQSIAKKNNISLIFNPDEKLYLPVLTSSRDLLVQTITNVVNNAIIYNKELGQVNVSTTINGRLAVVKIEDTGVGISKEEIKKVFDRFYRAEKSRSRQTGGSGLGLSIVHSIVNSLGGSVTLTSELGKGTTVMISLPIHKAS